MGAAEADQEGVLGVRVTLHRRELRQRKKVTLGWASIRALK